MTIKTFLQKIITSFVVLSFALLPTTTWAALIWTEVQPAGDSDLNWVGIASDDDSSNLIAANRGGRLYTSSDDGENWTERQPAGDIDEDWHTVASDSDGSHLIVGVGLASDGRLYTSSDGGENWIERQPAGDTDANWRSVASDSDGSHLIAARGGLSGRLYTSSDGGANWTERQPAGDVNANWNAVASDTDGSNLVAGVNGGRLYTSSDGGANWTERQPAGASNQTWNSVASDSDGSNLVVTRGNRIYTSSDGGANWTEHALGNIFGSVSSDSDGSHLIAASSPNDGAFSVQVSVDGGDSWEDQGAFVGSGGVGTAINSDGSRAFAGSGRLYVGGPDETAPTITALYPEDNATGVSPSDPSDFAEGVVRLAFDENVVAGTGNITLYDASDDSVVAVADVTSENLEIGEGVIVYFGILERETTYYILIDEGAFEDEAGNPFAGIADETTWNFTTQLNPTVLIDEDFITGEGFLTFEDDSYVESFAVQDDGKIVVGGYFNLYDNDEIGFGIARLNADGTLDETFDGGDGFDDWVQNLALQADGKILVGGGFSTYDSATSSYIARLDTDGSLDDTFMMGDGFNGNVQDIAIQDDGKIIVVGYFDGYNGSGTGYGIVRLNADGTIDEDFVTGVGFNDSPETVHIQDDGKILVGGYFDGYAGDLFGFGIARLNTDGSLDEAFVTGDGFDDGVEFITTDADGNVVLIGPFSDYDGTTANIIARLNADGSLDETFDAGDGFLYEDRSGTVYEIAIDEEGKIVVVGYFDEYDGGSTGYGIARLNTDGSLDNTFTTGDGFGSDGELFTLTLQDDGKILAGGYFEEYDGDTIGFGIARLIPPGDEEEEEEIEEEEETPSSGGRSSSSHRRSSAGGGSVPASVLSDDMLESLMLQLIALLQQLLEQLIAEQQN